MTSDEIEKGGATDEGRSINVYRPRLALHLTLVALTFVSVAWSCAAFALDTKTVEEEGLDAATRDFVAGMTDRYAIRLFEQLFIPKPWAIE